MDHGAEGKGTCRVTDESHDPIVRLTVTPLGARSAQVRDVARSVVNYLEGGVGDPGATLLAGTAHVKSYYADSIEGPGRWLGAGAAFRSLSGTIGREEFQRVLEGRHPATGERLVTARGSSQRDHLAVGTAARFDSAGEALYSISDAARLLDLTRAEVDEMVERGADGTSRAADHVTWLATVEIDGAAMIRDAEITRHLAIAAQPVDADQVRSCGDLEDLLTVSEVAQLFRVSRQYVRRLCARGERPGRSDRVASLPSTRADDGAFLIRRADVAEFAEQRTPPVARVGFDLTLTTEKSIGLLTMLTTGEIQERFVSALRTANDTAIRHMDVYASVARRRGEVVYSEGLTVASYLHGTSRSLDPHPHHHNVVANAVVDDEGGVRTLDARALYRHAPAAAALATAAVRWELRDLGLGWWQRDDGVWEIAGIDHDAIREFSRRRNEMDEVRAALEERLGRRITHDEENTIALSTRSDKQAVDPADLRTDWLTRADRVGLDIGSCLHRPDRAIACERLPDERHGQLFADLVHPTTGLCARSNTFGRADVMRAIADWSIVDPTGNRIKVIVPPSEVERLTARFCATDLVIEILAAENTIQRRDGTTIADGQHEPVFTTGELLAVRSEIVSLVGSSADSRAAVVAVDIVDATIDAHAHLTGEQVDLVTRWLTSGDRVQSAVGRAGSGKTTTMRAAAEAWSAAGYRVLGAAVKGEATRQLGDDAGIDTETVAMLLARADHGASLLDSRTVLIIDEASTLGDRDLLRLCHLAIEAGATLRLIGDTAQHGSVAAGGMFSELVELFDTRTPHLTATKRLLDPGERRRADLVRAGKVADAVDELVASGQLMLTDSEQDTHAAIVSRWYNERAAGRGHPMIHGRRRGRRILNELAQMLLIHDGDIDPTRAVELDDGRRLCVGDRIVARHGDRRVHPDGTPDDWMRNGTTGTVAAVRHADGPSDHDEVDIAIGGNVITCGRPTFDRPDGGLDLAYAVTSYAIQGSTAEVSTAHVGPTTGARELYVDITRGRQRNQLIGTRRISPDNDMDQHLPTEQAELAPTLRTRRAEDRLAMSTTTAPEVLGPLAMLRRRAELGDTSPQLQDKIQRTEARIRRIAEHEPSPTLLEVLGDCPTSPHGAGRWRTAVGDIAVYLASEVRRPEPGSSGIEAVIGSRATARDTAAWDLAAASIHAANGASRRSPSEAKESLPAGQGAHLHSSVARPSGIGRSPAL